MPTARSSCRSWPVEIGEPTQLFLLIGNLMTPFVLHASHIMRIAPAWIILAALPYTGMVTGLANGQERTLHYFQDGGWPPGALGRDQLRRLGALRGYYQPVECSVPAGATFSIASNGVFTKPVSGRMRVGLLIGAVYRLKITNVRFYEGRELFPTIELIQRLYPPEGQAERFPIPIQFTQEEIELALAGNYLTRVIYLEDPANPLPYQQAKGQQHVYEVRPHEDPLRVADQLGRPMAIVRMGSRLPLSTTPDDRFMFGKSPVRVLRSKSPNNENRASTSSKVEDSIVRETQRIPRLDTRSSQAAIAPTVRRQSDEARISTSRGRINR
ncbi:MAG: hypothetical protein CMJ75_20200 [Planctomycetaceae bacterium]|nr:hypothetical protein [Planctomycetaceae bacterium]